VDHLALERLALGDVPHEVDRGHQRGARLAQGALAGEDGAVPGDLVAEPGDHDRGHDEERGGDHRAVGRAGALRWMPRTTAPALTAPIAAQANRLQAGATKTVVPSAITNAV
jgi:hypothetical protein